MTQPITLYGELRCHKTRYYQAALEERGLEYELAQVDKNPEAAKRLSALTGSADKFPTFEINGRKLRNPTLPDLDKTLARSGLYDPGLVHDQMSRRFIRHMAPSDAFVSYTWQGERMVLGHIETDPSLRGSGLGARFATEVFEHLESAPHEVRLTCPFLRIVGATRPEWRKKFYLKDT
ncbi:N-acetyltransferase [Litoreibacter janthinus]|uniref:GCN5-related N-acetyl-transferase n=1 Tax=Litoreibacter janthinus TaxID=670154 RepID=A0A1I6H1T1_9RHOB|nr:N-acetyltransferase [Litoreibacter janthinus]SFR48332.1 GCN5-related N-acetyl-transferase [Litoreibacter janthinus]